MKNSRRLLLAMIALAASTAMVWGQTNAHKSAIVGSAHDFTSSTYTFTGTASGSTATAASTNLCYFCHITHKTATNSSGIGTTSSLAPGYLLWNHQLSAQGSYGVYSSDSFNALLAAGGSAITDLGGSNNLTSPTVSNLCLSCHDGTVAIASFYEGGMNLPSNGSSWNTSHGSSTTMYTGMEVADLTKSHPVNFNYTAALATASGGGLLSPASLNSVDAAGGVPLYGGAGMMECTTCHDPHNGTFGTVTVGTKTTTVFPFPRLTLGTLPTSSVCTYCHT